MIVYWQLLLNAPCARSSGGVVMGSGVHQPSGSVTHKLTNSQRQKSGGVGGRYNPPSLRRVLIQTCPKCVSGQPLWLERGGDGAGNKIPDEHIYSIYRIDHCGRRKRQRQPLASASAVFHFSLSQKRRSLKKARGGGQKAAQGSGE